jgi:phage anti-repressor protein
MLNIFKNPRKQEIVPLTPPNIDFTDPLVKKIQQHLSSQEQQLFIQSFYGYLNYDEENDYIIDLDDIYEWVGYTTKQRAKDMLLREFHENIDYKVLLSANAKQRGGHNKHQYLMTISTFEAFCMAAHTEKGKETRKYYKKMVNIMKEHTKEQLQIQTEQLKQKEIEFQAKESELQRYKAKTYEQIVINGYIYVIRTDGGIKVGKTKDIIKRLQSLQTANVNNIEIVMQFPTSNPDILERCVHYILDRYRCNHNREVFDCEVDYIMNIVRICGSTIDTLKSTYQHISPEELGTVCYQETLCFAFLRCS